MKLGLFILVLIFKCENHITVQKTGQAFQMLMFVWEELHKTLGPGSVSCDRRSLNECAIQRDGGEEKC